MEGVTVREYAPIHLEQALALYSSVQWTNYTGNPSMLASALRHSLKILAAYKEDRLIGILRAVGDGYSIVYIQDLIVLPQYQRQGVGKLLMKEMDLLYPHVYQKVLLTDHQPPSVRFYESCGFSLSTDLHCVAFVKFSP